MSQSPPPEPQLPPHQADTTLPESELPLSAAERRAQASWRHIGRKRPAFAVTPLAGQESVWDYPRPPRLAPDAREVVIRRDGIELAHSHRAVRVLETASPPSFYLPPEDVRLAHLVAVTGASHCEWKGSASYFCLAGDSTSRSRTSGEPIAWTYKEPTPRFAAIAGYLGFFPARVECYVDGVRVTPQDGGFYGGWITPELVGPFKGAPGSLGW